MKQSPLFFHQLLSVVAGLFLLVMTVAFVTVPLNLSEPPSGAAQGSAPAHHMT